MRPRHAPAALLAVLALAACRERAPAPVRVVKSRDAAPPAASPSSEPLSEASLLADVAWLTAPARRGRGGQSPEAIEVAGWLVGELEEAGYAPTVHRIGGLDGQRNVVAIYRPRVEAARTIVVTAHYDGLGMIDGVTYPGADDNASGVAIALAVARDLAARRDVAGRVVFAFLGAEELGLFGAHAYVAAPPHPLADTRAVFNLDMVGRRFFESALGADATLGAVGLPDDSELFDRGQDAARRAGLDLVAVSPALVAFVGEGWRSDDWVFRAAGVPAVHFSTGMHDDYHTPHDTIDRLSRLQLVRIAHFLRELVAATAR